MRQNDSWGTAALWVGLIVAGLTALWFARPARTSFISPSSMTSEQSHPATLNCSGGSEDASLEDDPVTSGQSEQAKSTFGRQRAACAERGLRAARAPMRLSRPRERRFGRLSARGPPAPAAAL
ncbi:MAG: hypothetical protein WAZ94_04345 [Phycisphaerales bacterium]